MEIEIVRVAWITVPISLSIILSAFIKFRSVNRVAELRYKKDSEESKQRCSSEERIKLKYLEIDQIEKVNRHEEKMKDMDNKHSIILQELKTQH